MSWVIVLKKKLRRYVPLICLGSGWGIGLLIFYLSKILGADILLYSMDRVAFSDVCSAIWTQLKLFIIISIFGFSMLSSIVPAALVLIRSILASFSCALVYSALASGGSAIRYAAFTLSSALICVFLTSSARLADIFYTKVPHGKFENILDYIARQLFTMGFATAVLIIYFTVCKVT